MSQLKSTMGSNRPELDERNFIHEEKSTFIWIFLAFFLLSFFLLWGIGFWQSRIEYKRLKCNAFYQVTRRDFSLFLWQHPNLNIAYKKYFDDMPELAGEYISVSDDILYRYHVWNRLVSDVILELPVDQKLLGLFLKENPLWLSKYRSTAPVGMQLAYQGWFNWKFRRYAIETFFPTDAQLRDFLMQYPHYQRHYWQNLIPNYLEKEAPIPYFLKSMVFTVTNPSL